jgi:O-antigen ligase
VVLWPEGLWQVDEDAFWLLGHRNNFGAPLIAAIAVAAAYDFVSRRHLSVSTVVIAVASLASVVRTWSASSVLTVALVTVVMMLIAVSRNGATALRPFLLLGVYAAVDVGIVVFHIQEQASALIEAVLNRSSDLTGRTRIWDLVFVMIQDSPLFGNGVQRAENNGLTVVDPNFVHAHNGELNLLLEGGLLTFVPFVVLVLIVTRNAARDYRSRAVQMLYLGLIISMVRAIQGLFFSSYSVLLVFLLLNAAIVARLEFEGERPRPIARGASAG